MSSNEKIFVLYKKNLTIYSLLLTFDLFHQLILPGSLETTSLVEYRHTLKLEINCCKALAWTKIMDYTKHFMVFWLHNVALFECHNNSHQLLGSMQNTFNNSSMSIESIKDKHKHTQRRTHTKILNFSINNGLSSDFRLLFAPLP